MDFDERYDDDDERCETEYDDKDECFSDCYQEGTYKLKKEPVVSSFSQYLAEFKDRSLLTKEEETSLIKRYRAGDIEAKDELIERNLRLVVFYCKKYMNCSIPFEDIVQEGNIGLMRAIDTFDPDKGKLSTYAIQWIRHKVERYISEYAATIRIPDFMNVYVKKIKAFQNEYEEQYGQSPSIETISKALDYSEDTVSFLLRVSRPVLSLNMPIITNDEESKYSLLEHIEDKDSMPLDTRMERNDLKKFLREELQDLKPMERDVILLRFGFIEDRKFSLQEIADLYHLSRERIRQIETSALSRLRKKMNKQNIEFADFALLLSS